MTVCEAFTTNGITISIILAILIPSLTTYFVYKKWKPDKKAIMIVGLIALFLVLAVGTLLVSLTVLKPECGRGISIQRGNFTYFEETQTCVLDNIPHSTKEYCKNLYLSRAGNLTEIEPGVFSGEITYQNYY